MRNSFIKRILRLIIRAKRREDDQVAVCDRAEARVPGEGRDIYSSIMRSEVKTATEEEIDSTVDAIASIVEGAEVNTDETDPDWRERRERTIVISQENLDTRW